MSAQHTPGPVYVVLKQGKFYQNYNLDEGNWTVDFDRAKKWKTERWAEQQASTCRQITDKRVLVAVITKTTGAAS